MTAVYIDYRLKKLSCFLFAVSGKCYSSECSIGAKDIAVTSFILRWADFLGTDKIKYARAFHRFAAKSDWRLKYEASRATVQYMQRNASVCLLRVSFAREHTG